MGQRYFALDFVRAVAILCVLLAHAWYASFPAGAVDGSLMAKGMLVSFLFYQGCNGLFIMVSGALIIPKEQREGYPLLWRRVMDFLLLAGFWSIATNVCAYVADGWTLGQALVHSVRYHSFLFGGWTYRAGHLWFLSVICGLYLAAPFVARLAYAMPWRSYLMFAGISCMLFLVPGTFDVAGTGRSFLDPDTMGTFGGYDVFGVYVSWFLLGHLFWSVDVRSCVGRVTRHYRLFLLGLLVFTVGAGGAMELVLTGGREIYAPLHLFRSSLPIFLETVFCFLLLKDVAPQLEHGVLGRGISLLARRSFGIYLSHYGLLFLLFAIFSRHGLGPEAHSFLPVVLTFLLSLTGSWLLTAICWRVRWLRALVH